jgi:hypothetical protein
MLAPRLPASAALAALARLYIALAIWRRGPQDVPAVGILLPLTIGAYVLLSVLVGELLPLQPGLLLQLAADVAFILLWYWLLLAIAGRRERYLQTVTAIFGLQCVLAAPSIVSMWLVERFADDTLWRTPAYIAAYAVPLWTQVAVAYILRATLERGLGLCLILAFIELLAEVSAFVAIFPSAR